MDPNIRSCSLKTKSRSTRGYTIYSIVGTILEIAVLLAIVYWGLPFIGIQLPFWGTILLFAAFLSYSYFTYSMGKRALTKKLRHDMESLIGCEGKVITPLTPIGYVKIRGELWKASSSFQLNINDEIVVTGIENLQMIVSPNADNTFSTEKAQYLASRQN
jgi:membrane-bound serine protease (ClpP class)